MEFSEARDGDAVGNAGSPSGNITMEACLLANGYKIEVTSEDLTRFLGVQKFEAEMMDRESLVGVSTGLAYQGSGNGGILRECSPDLPDNLFGCTVLTGVK